MDLLFNECSLHSQFNNIDSFRDAIGRLMVIRRIAMQHGRQLSCHHSLADFPASEHASFRELARQLDTESLRSLLQWLTNTGPFWNEEVQHDQGEWIEHDGELITGSAIAEAAHATRRHAACSLVSVDPSRWLSSPLEVTFCDSSPTAVVRVENYWDADVLRTQLETIAPEPRSWFEVESRTQAQCTDLTFLKDCWAPLVGLPFNLGAAKRVIWLLGLLQDFKLCFDENGNRTAQGHHMYQTYFTGANAHFSDSSESEKARFRQSLTFRHPDLGSNALLCTWHGKVRAQQLRIHFSWPVRSQQPLYVAYVGPKITKV